MIIVRIFFCFFINYRNTYVLLVDEDQSTRNNKTHIFGIITSIDLLQFIVKHNKSNDDAKQNGSSEEEKINSTVAKESEALKWMRSIWSKQADFFFLPVEIHYYDLLLFFFFGIKEEK